MVVRIREDLAISDDELELSASRSSGPGGQHVNKVSSRVTLRFDVAGSPSLDDGQKRRIAHRLGNRITRDGVLVLHAQAHRSQAMNRALVIERFAEMLREALKRRRPRRKTRPTKASRERRLSDKRQRSAVKRKRGRPGSDD